MADGWLKEMWEVTKKHLPGPTAAIEKAALESMSPETKADVAETRITERDLTASRKQIDAKLGEAHLPPGLVELLGVKTSLDHMFGTTGAAKEEKPGFVAVAKVALNPDKETLDADTAHALALLGFAAKQAKTSLDDLIPKGEDKEEIVGMLHAAQEHGKVDIAAETQKIESTVDRYALRVGLKALGAAGVLELEGGAVDPTSDTPLSNTEYTDAAKAIAAAKILGAEGGLKGAFDGADKGQDGTLAQDDVGALAKGIPAAYLRQGSIKRDDLTAFLSAAAREQARRDNDFATIAAKQTMTSAQMATSGISDKIGKTLEDWGVDAGTRAKLQETLKGFMEAFMPIVKQIFTGLADLLSQATGAFRAPQVAGTSAPSP